MDLIGLLRFDMNPLELLLRGTLMYGAGARALIVKGRVRPFNHGGVRCGRSLGR